MMLVVEVTRSAQICLEILHAMAQLHWPIIHRRRPKNAIDHAASLEADFEALDASVKLSTSKHHRLPSSLLKDIIRAIFKAFSDHE